MRPIERRVFVLALGILQLLFARLINWTFRVFNNEYRNWRELEMQSIIKKYRDVSAQMALRRLFKWAEWSYARICQTVEKRYGKLMIMCMYMCVRGIVACFLQQSVFCSTFASVAPFTKRKSLSADHDHENHALCFRLSDFLLNRVNMLSAITAKGGLCRCRWTNSNERSTADNFVFQSAASWDGGPSLPRMFYTFWISAPLVIFWWSDPKSDIEHHKIHSFIS